MSNINEVMYIRPSVGARVDYGNPIAHGLWFCYLFNEGGGNQVFDAGNMDAGPLTFSGSPLPTWGSHGVILNGGYLRNNASVVSRFNPIAGSHTLRFVHRPSSYPGFFNTVFEVVSGGRALSLFLSSTGFVTYVAVGGTDHNISTAGSASVMPVGRVSDLVWVFERGDRTDGGSAIYKHLVYVDGVLTFTYSSASVGSTWPTTGVDMNVGFGPSGGVGNYYGEILQLQGWSRGLQASEIRDLYSNPHALVSDGPYYIIGKTAVTNATATATFATITLTAPTATAFEETSATATATFGTITLTAPTAEGSQADTATATFGTITLTAPTASGSTPDNTASASFRVIYLQAPTASPFGPPFTVYMQDQCYWGRFSRGQFLNVMWHPEEEPSGVATIEFWHEATTIVKTITLPSLDDVYISYGFNLLLDNKFVDGNYVAVIKFTSGVTDQCSLGYLSVMGGTGSPPVIGILEIDRTLGRSVITQDSDGRFMIGYQPQLAAYAVE